METQETVAATTTTTTQPAEESKDAETDAAAVAAEESTPAVQTPSKEDKKDKVKKKRSFRSFSFLRREKKTKEENNKNGDVAAKEVGPAAHIHAIIHHIFHGIAGPGRGMSTDQLSTASTAEIGSRTSTAASSCKFLLPSTTVASFFFGRSRACSSRWGSVCVCVCSSRGSIDDQVVGGACRRRLGLTLGRGGGHRNGRVTHGRRSKRRRRHQTATAGTTLVSVELEKSKKKPNKFGAVVVGRRFRFASSSRCNLAPRCEVLDSWNLVADFL